MVQKSLLTKLGELLDAHRAEQAATRSSLPLTAATHWRRWVPTPGNVVFTLIVIVSFLWAQSAGALPLAAPTAASTGTIAYQGRLADTAGQPLTGTYNMTFRLYSAASGGAPLWEEPWNGANSVQVSDGLFNVMLGSLASIPQNIVAANSSLFLGITVGTDSEMAPRVQLGSVPFAVQALTVPDGSITKTKLADDINLTPTDGSITAAKLANSSVTTEKLNAGAVTGAKLADGAVTSEKLNIGNLSVNGTGMFGTPNSHDFEGGEIMLAEHRNGPRWFIDNQRTRLRAFNCSASNCVEAMYLYPNGNLWVKGELQASGAKPALIDTASYGRRKVYAAESPEVRLFDEGMATLHNGTARVPVDPIFLETIAGEFLINVTPYGDAGLYVAEVGKDYFDVRLRDGAPDVSFAWRLSATRKGYTGVRLEDAADTGSTAP